MNTKESLVQLSPTDEAIQVSIQTQLRKQMQCKAATEYKNHLDHTYNKKHIHEEFWKPERIKT